MDKYLKRLCKAILDEKFNDKRYRSRRSYYGYEIMTMPIFASYGTIGFEVFVYDEKGHHRHTVRYDWEMGELDIDETPWRDWFCIGYLDECGIWKKDGDDEFHCYTPNGDEEMFIPLEKPRRKYLQEYIDNFDIDEQVSIWWTNGQKGSGVPFDNMKEHYEDYEEYLKNLQEVCDGMPY